MNPEKGTEIAAWWKEFHPEIRISVKKATAKNMPNKNSRKTTRKVTRNRVKYSLYSQISMTCDKHNGATFFEGFWGDISNSMLKGHFSMKAGHLIFKWTRISLIAVFLNHVGEHLLPSLLLALNNSYRLASMSGYFATLSLPQLAANNFLFCESAAFLKILSFSAIHLERHDWSKGLVEQNWSWESEGSDSFICKNVSIISAFLRIVKRCLVSGF